LWFASLVLSESGWCQQPLAACTADSVDAVIITGVWYNYLCIICQPLTTYTLAVNLPSRTLHPGVHPGVGPHWQGIQLSYPVRQHNIWV
jgi:hypothetical protein